PLSRRERGEIPTSPDITLAQDSGPGGHIAKEAPQLFPGRLWGRHTVHDSLSETSGGAAHIISHSAGRPIFTPWKSCSRSPTGLPGPHPTIGARRLNPPITAPNVSRQP